ncbi:TVP38/TMEM64 family protein [Haloferax larsenii]|uniref:TVP38/TMEM64 family protein n=1 Tax=Haloferax larsenii TaxID=302484 RepID=UPI001F4CCAAC|nr:TVP38/TMEM64 family protein [Haloferax larsenii]
MSKSRVAVHLLIVVAVGGGVLYTIHDQIGLFTSVSRLKAFILSFGVFAPVVFIALQALQVVVAPIPGQVMGFASGYIFGGYWGTLYSIIGITLGSFVAFVIARRVGRAYVERVVDPDIVERFDSMIDERGVMAVFVLFLIPGLPDDAICFIAGLSLIRIRTLVVLAFVGRLPAFLIVNVAGGELAESRIESMVGLLVLLVALSVLGYRYQEQILSLGRSR